MFNETKFQRLLDTLRVHPGASILAARKHARSWHRHQWTGGAAVIVLDVLHELGRMAADMDALLRLTEGPRGPLRPAAQGQAEADLTEAWRR
jgi:hypothetical protein